MHTCLEYYLGIDPSTLSDEEMAMKFEMLTRIRAMEADKSITQMLTFFGRGL